MAIREWLNCNSNVTLGLVAGVVVLAVGFVVFQVMATRPAFRTDLPEAYFTVDDGKSFFAANSANVPPFDHEGQIAVRAHVYECQGHRFVGFLERYTPEAHQAMVANTATPQHQIYGRELKKPGEAKWVKSGDLDAVGSVTEVRCPEGHAGTPEPVEP